ncbi:MAG: class I SAM-dependent methyltransferase [Bacteroidota bacterium]|nr:class I SAM-dependent methyltransferase [Bacteroidota bacterium]
MKRSELFHPRVFTDQEWAEGYYQRNAKNIERVGKRYVNILSNSGFKKGRILDAGCGFGSVAIEIAKNFKNIEIVGIDLSEPLLKMGHLLADKAGVADQVTFSLGDVQKLDFETDSFDLVINTFMIHIVDNPLAMLNEIERVTKNQGQIMITDLRRTFLGLFVKKLRTAFTLEEGMEIVNESNLRLGISSKGSFWWDYMVGI